MTSGESPTRQRGVMSESTPTQNADYVVTYDNGTERQVWCGPTDRASAEVWKRAKSRLCCFGVLRVERAHNDGSGASDER